MVGLRPKLLVKLKHIIKYIRKILYFIFEKKLTTTINDFRWILHGNHRLAIFSNVLLSCFLLLLVSPGFDGLFQQAINLAIQYFLIGLVKTLLEWQTW